VISGKVMEDYRGVKGVEAEHVTLAIENPHTEVQVLNCATFEKHGRTGDGVI
jgi:hypothetical protein